MKEKKVRLKLENIYGGDGFERPEILKVDVYGEKEKIEVVRKDIGIPVESTKKTTKTREKEITIHTFKRDEDSTPLYRLGGTHGKLWGAMREAGYNMAETGKIKSKALVDRILRSVQIMPQWVKLEMQDGVEMQRDELPQILAGIGKPMITQYYDVIPECEAEVTLRFPEEFEEIVMDLLDRAQSINFGNKRRGVLTLL